MIIINTYPILGKIQNESEIYIVINETILKPLKNGPELLDPWQSKGYMNLKIMKHVCHTHIL
jgi:hypothetical protein